MKYLFCCVCFLLVQLISSQIQNYGPSRKAGASQVLSRENTLPYPVSATNLGAKNFANIAANFNTNRNAVNSGKNYASGANLGGLTAANVGANLANSGSYNVANAGALNYANAANLAAKYNAASLEFANIANSAKAGGFEPINLANIGNSNAENLANINAANLAASFPGGFTMSKGSQPNTAIFTIGSEGNVFTVTSGSPGSPGYGVQVAADALEVGGTVAVSGQMPLYGTVTLNGEVPTNGIANVNCGSEGQQDLV